MGWYEDWAKELRTEREEAIFREFDRRVTAGQFESREDTFLAFVAGWHSEMTFKQDKQDRQLSAGPGWSFLFWMVGGMVLAMVIIALLWASPGVLILTNVYGAAAFSAVFIALGFISNEREKRKAKEAHDEFVGKWGKPE